jgi:hypothetical protein
LPAAVRPCLGGARVSLGVPALPGRTGLPPSCVYQIENSTWLLQACEQRLKNYPKWRNWDDRKYVHYIVHGHDNYYEILASGFTEKKVPYDEAGELKRLADEA